MLVFSYSVFTNVLISLAIRIQEKTKNIRFLQQEDLKERRDLDKFDSTNFQAEGLMNKDESQVWIYAQGFEELQKRFQEQRNEDIIKIVSSIHSLNTIYKELQGIVIEQGSLLDRIDQNIESTTFNIKQANVQLEKAEEHQRSSVANKIICILVGLIFLCGMILLVRN